MLLPDFPRRACALSWLALGLLSNGAVLAQAQNAEPAVSAPPLVLRPSSLLQEKITDDTRQQLPSFLQSDSVSGRTDVQSVLDGHVQFRRGDLLLKADHLEYNQIEDLAKARGNVYINRAGFIYQGPELELHLDALQLDQLGRDAL